MSPHDLPEPDRGSLGFRKERPSRCLTLDSASWLDFAVPAVAVRALSRERLVSCRPGDCYVSTSAGRARDLSAGKLTPKLSDRIADVRGRQYPTRSGQTTLEIFGCEAVVG